MATIRQADFDVDMDDILRLWRAYLDWANDELNRADRVPIVDGVGCLKRIRDDAAEIKRMYVEPEQRGNGVGHTLLDALLVAGRHEGYSRVLLDSVGFMHDAHRLYRSAGFVDSAPHPESEIPEDLQRHWVFMELSLRK